MRTFFISDLHLQHKNCAEWRGFSSLDEHDEFIIDNWNSRVRDKDKVIITGDVCFQTNNLNILSELNGIKHLVLGNHEHTSVSRYQNFFNKISSLLTYANKLVLTHIPIHPSQLKHRYLDHVNIHGHIHRNEPLLFIHDVNYFNINCEFHEYMPILFDDLMEMISRKQEGIYSEYGNL
jgi:calcineurin-like phosphoesterase family protein